MKQFLALVLSLILCLSFSACGSQQTPADSPSDTAAASTDPVPAEETTIPEETDPYEAFYCSWVNLRGDGTMTLDDFAALKEAQPEVVSTGAVGKLLDSYTWYVAVPVERALLDRFDEGGRYRLTFPYNYNLTLEMTLERAVTEYEREDAVLIFACTSMPEGFSYLRVQNVEITMRAQSGILVPEEAVRIVDGVTGVYILHGGKVEFRRIVILLQRDGDCIVDATLVAGEKETPFLSAHEHIITAGKDLYDGKVLN